MCVSICSSLDRQQRSVPSRWPQWEAAGFFHPGSGIIISFSIHWWHWPLMTASAQPDVLPSRVGNSVVGMWERVEWTDTRTFCFSETHFPKLTTAWLVPANSQLADFPPSWEGASTPPPLTFWEHKTSVCSAVPFTHSLFIHVQQAPIFLFCFVLRGMISCLFFSVPFFLFSMFYVALMIWWWRAEGKENIVSISGVIPAFCEFRQTAHLLAFSLNPDSQTIFMATEGNSGWLACHTSMDYLRLLQSVEERHERERGLSHKNSW